MGRVYSIGERVSVHDIAGDGTVENPIISDFGRVTEVSNDRVKVEFEHYPQYSHIWNPVVKVSYPKDWTA